MTEHRQSQRQSQRQTEDQAEGQAREQPGDAEVGTLLRQDMHRRPTPVFIPDLQAVKRRGLRRRRRAQLLPAAVVLALLGGGAAAAGAGVLPGVGQQGTVTVVPAQETRDGAGRTGSFPAWCQGGSISYDYDGTGLASPELALQYLIDLASAQVQHLQDQPESAAVDDALAQNRAMEQTLQALKGQAAAMGTDRVRQNGAVVVDDGQGHVTARAKLEEVQSGQWNVTTVSFAAPVVPECGR